MKSYEKCEKWSKNKFPEKWWGLLAEDVSCSKLRAHKKTT